MNCCTAQSSGADAPGPATTLGQCAVSELRGLLESPAGPARPIDLSLPAARRCAANRPERAPPARGSLGISASAR